MKSLRTNFLPYALALGLTLFSQSLQAANDLPPETKFAPYGGTHNTEPCLVGNENGICQGFPGHSFDGHKSILGTIADDLNRIYGTRGKFERVPDGIDNVWQELQSQSPGQPITITLRTRYTSVPLKFGFFRGDGSDNPFEQLLSSNVTEQAGSKIILSTCVGYEPLRADNQDRCATPKPEFTARFTVGEGNLFHFGIQEAKGEAGARATLNHALGRPTTNSSNRTFSSIPVQNPNQKDMMVTFRFSEQLPSGPDRSPRYHYVIAFTEDPNKSMSDDDYNALVIEVTGSAIPGRPQHRR